MTEVKKLKRAVIKEEYVAITGDFVKATLLNQFIYWSERVKDFDGFIEQENKRALDHGLTQQDITNGWLYKTAEELSEETMLGLSVASMRTHIKTLIDLNYISERNNPKYKWDRTKQYRVNLVEIAKALIDKGYNLEGYKIKLPFLNFKNGVKEIENGNNENLKAIPENTTKINSNNTKKKESKKETFDDLINSFTENEEERELLGEWLKVRKAKRAAMTTKAIELNLNKLRELASKSNMSIIEYLKEIICRGWQAFYEIKNYKINEQKKEKNKWSVSFSELYDTVEEIGGLNEI